MKQKFLFTVLALCELLVPRQLIALIERLAFTNPGEATLRPQTPLLARLEAATWLTLAIRGGWSNPVIRVIAAVCGALMALLPRRVLALSLRLAYQNPEAIELRSWVVPATRSLGVTYLRFALRTGDRKAS